MVVNAIQDALSVGRYEFARTTTKALHYLAVIFHAHPCLTKPGNHMSESSFAIYLDMAFRGRRYTVSRKIAEVGANGASK